VGRERLSCRACGDTTLPVDDVIDLKLGDALWPFCANQRYAKDAGNLAEIGTRAACVTGLDLLFYWIMPIVMLSTTLDDPLPFRDVVIHPLVCDENGNKMGKSVGNVVVPSEIVARYGADCLRLSLFDGLDLFEEKLFFSDEKLERNRQWLGRLVAAAETLMSRGHSGPSPGPSGPISDLENAFRIAIDGYRLSELHAIACAAIERLERASKRETNDRDTTLGDVLALLHPLAPLTTESLWGRAFPREGLLAAYVTPSKREPEAGRRKAV
jgi:valyl-tRNA synthetase